MANYYNNSAALVLVPKLIRNGKAKRQSQQRRQRVTRMPDPVGRLDIALTRLLDLAVDRFADPMLQQLYPTLRDDVAKVIGNATGPRTHAGKFARKAVSAIQLAQALSQRKCGTAPNNNGGAA